MANSDHITAAFQQEKSSSDGLSSAEAAHRLAQYGPNTIADHTESKWHKLAAYFWGPLPFLIEAAAIISALRRDWGDFAVVAGLLIYNAAVGFWQDNKAANALAALKKGLALRARVRRGGKWETLDATDLVPGDVVDIAGGQIVPADVVLIDGEYLSCDQAALTGESLPVSKKVGDQAYSGSIAKQGAMTGLVTATGSNTFFGRTAKLVGSAGAVSHSQRAVTQVGDFLLLLALVLRRGPGWRSRLSLRYCRRLELVRIRQSHTIRARIVDCVNPGRVACCDVRHDGDRGLCVVAPEGDRLPVVRHRGARRRGHSLQRQDRHSDEEPAYGRIRHSVRLGQSRRRASRCRPRHPKKQSGRNRRRHFESNRRRSDLQGIKQTAFVPFDPVNKRTISTVVDQGGQVRHYAKGAPQAVASLANPDSETLERYRATVSNLASKGYRALGVARSNDGKAWEIVGIVSLMDPPRADAKTTIAEAKALGLNVKMVTGDDVAIGDQIADQLGIGDHLLVASDVFGQDTKATAALSSSVVDAVERADGFARVFPEHKYEIVKTLQSRGHIVGMTGDGVNDAPALKQADCGIAVSGATDAARSAAALILTAPGLSTTSMPSAFPARYSNGS